MPPSEPSPSIADVETWLHRLGHPAACLTPLAGDVSARRYLRAESAGRSFIVALYPPSMRASCARFLTTSGLLRKGGLRVPEVLASDCELGLMLLEDFGPRTLYDSRDASWSELSPQLERAIDDARRIAALPIEAVAGLSPHLDRQLLDRELEQTWRSYLQPQELVGDRSSAAALRAGLSELCRRLGDEPAAPCHRDFMARNLVVLPEGRLGILDHQDLRLGPAFYDLASLLNDSLYPPAELCAQLLGARAGEPAYHRAVAQRTLKSVGTFATFAERGDPRHLRLIPAALRRALDHLLRIPETTEIMERLAERWRLVC